MNYVTAKWTNATNSSVRLFWALRYLLCFVLALSPTIANATNEVESFALLVETLIAVEDQPDVCSSLMRGMLSGLEGRRNVPPPAGWSELSKRFGTSHDKNVRELSMSLSQVFGDREATRRCIELLKDRSADENQRRSALRSLLDQKCDRVSEVFELLLDEPAFTLDAIRGCSSVVNTSAPSILLSRYEQYSPELRRAVIETLATRKDYSEALLDAIKQKKVACEDIPTHVARSLSEILGKRFVELFGDVRPIAVDREKTIARYKKILTDEAIESANALRGRVVFQKTCAACHLLYGEGGKVGPDLTGSNRANLDYILLNSIDPSYDVPDGYKTIQILTFDGRVITGVLAEEDAIRVVLKTAEQPRVVVAKEDIETRKVSPKSMMPDGQLDQMKPQEVIDLIKYLRATQQVEIAK
jgi:putative heme-binding domain-containing protein